MRRRPSWTASTSSSGRRASARTRERPRARTLGTHPPVAQPRNSKVFDHPPAETIPRCALPRPGSLEQVLEGMDVVRAVEATQDNPAGGVVLVTACGVLGAPPSSA